ncbi:phospholipase DDHD1 [Anabrus simplex]|uniref:phospholipase DDHD1 n=1 Tax=Anabrus simplex TaxID=316456 RepID=UPI0034DD0041
MNFPHPSSGSVNSACQLSERLADISIHTESAYDYTDVGSDEVLYVTQQEITSESFCYEQTSSPLDAAGNAGCPTAGQWEYIAPDSKSLDSVVDELGPEEVRWFYKCESDKRWLEFSGYDSLRIEFKYRQLSHEWHFYSQENWTEAEGKETFQYAESALSVDSNVSGDDGSSYDYNGSGSACSAVSEHKIVVRGGMYEVDLQEWKCFSIYWPKEECAITRGNWFYDSTWQPLEVDHSNRIETCHLEQFYGHKLADYMPDPASKTQKTVLRTLSFPEFHVDWYSPTEVYLYSEAAPSKLVRSFTQKLGFQKSTGYRLYRGYKEQATQTDRPVDITHLVFVIHGIGQKMDTGRIIRNTSTFRDCVAWVKQKYFQSSAHRAEFFPVEWRSSLKLDGDIVEAITPHKLLGLRHLLNSSAMDIMYYTSPLYGCEVQRGLLEELNRLYTMFSRRNPYFAANGGKVSVIAHSLGCVIVYDIVTGWRPGCWQVDSPASAATGASSVPDTPHRDVGPPTLLKGLLFQIDNLFCLGSPLSVFLALRSRNPQNNILPSSLCRRLYNVFHPSDPVAYRMEPLLVREYSRIAPLQIQAYNATARLNYDLLPLEPLVIEPVGAASTAPGAKKEGDDSDSPGGTPSKDRGWSIWGLMKGSWKPQDDAGSPQLDSLIEGLPYRLDYVLRESNLGASYISALTSHTAYWSNYDVAYFVLTRLFPELEGEPEACASAAVLMPPDTMSK